jgi:glycosyltransferase involved in cell wall biosynthesis
VLQQAVAALPKGSVHLHIHGPSQGPKSPAWSFHGAYLYRDLAKLMHEIDVVALPSLWDENQPMVALEARAFGKALIVSDAGGLPELVSDGIDGWVFPAGNPEDWAQGIAILAADRSKTLQAGLSSQLPDSAETMAGAYLHGYRRALHKETFAPALTEGSPVEDNVPSRP